MNLARYVRVVPSAKDGDEWAQASAGTRVFCGDQEITGITRLTLTAELGQPWKAVIECLVIPPEVEAECAQYIMDVTSLSDDANRYQRIAEPKG